MADQNKAIPYELFCAALGIEVHEINYDGEAWRAFIAGLEAPAATPAVPVPDAPTEQMGGAQVAKIVTEYFAVEDGEAFVHPSYGSGTFFTDDCKRAAPTTESAAAPADLIDEIDNALGGWSGGLADTISGIVDKYRFEPNCGACPGDGSVCKTACRLSEESPPIAAEGAATSERKPLTDAARDAAFLAWVKGHRKGWFRQWLQHFPEHLPSSNGEQHHGIGSDK